MLAVAACRCSRPSIPASFLAIASLWTTPMALAEGGQRPVDEAPMLMAEDVMHAQHQRPMNLHPTDVSRRVDITAGAVAVRFRSLDYGGGSAPTRQIQSTEAIRAVVYLDHRARLGVAGSVATGRGFNGGWNPTGLGTGAPSYDLSPKQLFVTARPTERISIDAGGLYLARGDSTEATSYDNDGYIVGERLTFHHAFGNAVDSVIVTAGHLGDFDQANVFKRLGRIADTNYGQLIVTKRVGHLSMSGQYSFERDRHIARAAVVSPIAWTRLMEQLRAEMYVRFSPVPAYGYALMIQRHATTRLMVSGGLARIDGLYGSSNGDFFASGTRSFAAASLRLSGGLSVSAQAARRLDHESVETPRIRVDIALAYDVLHRDGRR
jgi:hypothetical protein